MADYPSLLAGSPLRMVALFLYVFYDTWQESCADEYREQVFEARDRLFDAAASTSISFDSVEYKAIRQAFNANIQNAHSLSWVSVLWVWLFFLVSGVKPRCVLHTVIDEIRDPEIKAIFEKEVMVAQRAYIKMLASRSLLVLPLFYAWEIGTSVAQRLARRRCDVNAEIVEPKWRIRFEENLKPIEAAVFKVVQRDSEMNAALAGRTIFGA